MITPASWGSWLGAACREYLKLPAGPPSRKFRPGELTMPVTMQSIDGNSTPLAAQCVGMHSSARGRKAGTPPGDMLDRPPPPQTKARGFILAGRGALHARTNRSGVAENLGRTRRPKHCADNAAMPGTHQSRIVLAGSDSRDPTLRGGRSGACCGHHAIVRPARFPPFAFTPSGGPRRVRCRSSRRNTAFGLRYPVECWLWVMPQRPARARSGV